MFKIKIGLEFTADQIAGLLCDGMDTGAINYWAMVGKRAAGTPVTFKGDWAKYPLYSYPLAKGGYVEIIETGDGNREVIHRLTRKAIEKGLQAMAEKSPRHFASFVSEDTDAETGDVFIQMCLFGEIKYG